MVEGLASKQVEEGKGAHAGYLPGRIETGRDGESRALHLVRLRASEPVVRMLRRALRARWCRLRQQGGDRGHGTG